MQKNDKEQMQFPETRVFIHTSGKSYNMLLGQQKICSISRNIWLTRSHRCIYWTIFVYLMLCFAVFKVKNHHELPYNAKFISRSQQVDFTNNLQSGKSKINPLRRSWNIIVPPPFQSEERTSRSVPNHFRYVINEEHKCQAGSPFLMLMIPVAPREVFARQAIRNTWGNESLVPGVHIIRIFLLGIASEPGSELQQRIMEESTKYHDIIQQEYLDTYRNLTIKTLMGMNWVATYCPDTAYVMKVDSDMFLNPEYLIYNVLKTGMPRRHGYFTGCIMKGRSPFRNRKSKWYMPPEEYPGNRYPPFCSGTGYVFSGDLARKIFNVSLSIKRLPLEDVYMGVCLAALGLEPVPPPKSSDFNILTIPFSTCRYSKIVTSHKIPPGKKLHYWQQMQQNKSHPC